MKFKEYIEYWEQAARSNKAISHNPSTGKISFKRMNIDDVWNSVKLDLKDKVMIVENPEIRTYDGGSDNYRKMMSGGVLFIEEVKLGDVNDELNKLDALETITEQFAAKIVNDVRKFKQNQNHTWKIKGLDLNTIALNKVGPLFGNWHGWRLTFTFNQTFADRLFLKNEEWINDTAFSIND